jgi:hypothetical protein
VRLPGLHDLRFPSAGLDALHEIAGIDLDESERVVVHRDRQLRVDELRGLRRIDDPHGEVVADRKQCHVERAVHLGDQLHVQEETGVAGVIDLLAVHGDHDPRGIAERLAVGPGRPVVRDRQLDVAEGELPSPADVQRMRGQAALLEPARDLVVRNDERLGVLRDLDRVADVIAVAVRDDDGVELFEGRRGDVGQGVAGQERIDEDAVGAVVELPTRMAVKREIEHRNSPRQGPLA